MDDLIAELKKAEQEADQELWDKWLIFCWRYKKRWSVWFAWQIFTKNHPKIDIERLKRTSKSGMGIQLFMASYYRKVSDLLFDGAGDEKALAALRKCATNTIRHDLAKASAEKKERRASRKENDQEKMNTFLHVENNAAHSRNWRTTK